MTELVNLTRFGCIEYLHPYCLNHNEAAIELLIAPSSINEQE